MVWKCTGKARDEGAGRCTVPQCTAQRPSCSYKCRDESLRDKMNKELGENETGGKVSSCANIFLRIVGVWKCARKAVMKVSVVRRCSVA